MPRSSHPETPHDAAAPRPGARTRREVTTFLAGVAALVGLAPAALAQEIEPPLDPRLAADTVTFQVRKHVFKGLLVRPRVGPKRPGILLIPDQRGPNPHWRALARRFAMDGFVVLLPDLLAPFNLPEGSDEGSNLMARIIPAEHHLSLDAAADLLAKHPECNGSIAVVGFVWGGPYAIQFAISGARVKAAVVFHAMVPAPEKVATVKVPVLFHWAENDPRTAPLMEPLERRMIGAGRVFEAWVYPGLAGPFASDPTARGFDRPSLDRALERTVFFLRRHLGAGG
ncbi:MAG: dienelactone hydrolase family protein [Siculibacillus sp.]|nr:dienelactone hydrolase family protein [Siculibacillus sp.]